jgi:hypothetical protein
LGVVEGWGVGEEDGNLVAGELVEDHDLVGVGPGEAVRREAPHGVDPACFGRVAQGVEAGRSRRAPE